MLEPVMRNTTEEILKQLGVENQGFESAKEFGPIKEGTKVNKGENLFNRLDTEKELEKLHALNNKLVEERLGVKKEEKEEESQSKAQIKIDDFDKLDLVVGKILEVNDHPDADRLLVFKVDIGSETRTIVSSIKEFYKKEDLVGKNIAVIKNLKPVKMRGILSEGMLLAAGDDAVLLTTIKDCKPGTVIS